MKRPFLYPAVSLSLGIVIGSVFAISIAPSILMAASFLALAVIFSRHSLRAHVFLYLSILFLGISLYRNSSLFPAGHISAFLKEGEEKVFLTGVVIDDPATEAVSYGRERTSLTLKADLLRQGALWRRTNGLVRVNIYRSSDSGKRGAGHAVSPAFGDEILLEGLIARPAGFKNPGLFDYPSYLRLKNIYAVLRVKDGFFVDILRRHCCGWFKAFAYRLRDRIRVILGSYFKRSVSGFLKAILIGDRTSLGERLKEDFIKTGTIHILAISGLHVGLIAALFLSIFSVIGIPRRAAYVLAMAAILLYSVIAGSSPPVVRASIMFAVFAVGRLIWKDADILNSLALAAIAMLIAEPKSLFDAGFQLSFVSIASIAILSPRIDAFFHFAGTDGSSVVKKTRLYVSKSAATSLAACLGVWPIAAFHFNIFPPVAVLANIIVIPCLFIVMTLSVAFLATVVILPACANHAAQVLVAAVKTLFAVNHFFSAFPFAYFRTPPPGAAFLLIYYSAISITLLWGRKLRTVGFGKRPAALLFLVLLNVFVWRDIAFPERRILKATFLDVGQGDSAVVELPGKRVVLIDAGTGGEEDEFDVGRSVVAPYLWNNGMMKLDVVAVSHFHKDHLGGILYILENFRVGCVVENGAKPVCDRRLYHAYQKALRRRRIRRLVVREGDELRFRGGARILVLNPPSARSSCQRSGGKDFTGARRRTYNSTESPAMEDSNDNSLVMKFIFENSSILFSGDITRKTIERILSYDDLLKSDVLKAPHHGSFGGDEKIMKIFLGKVAPKIRVVSKGQNGPRKKDTGIQGNDISSSSTKSYETNQSGAVVVKMGANFCESEGVIKK